MLQLNILAWVHHRWHCVPDDPFVKMSHTRHGKAEAKALWIRPVKVQTSLDLDRITYTGNKRKYAEAARLPWSLPWSLRGTTLKPQEQVIVADSRDPDGGPAKCRLWLSRDACSRIWRKGEAGVEQKATFLVRSWVVMRSPFMTASQGTEGGQWEMASWQLLTSLSSVFWDHKTFCQDQMSHHSSLRLCGYIQGHPDPWWGHLPTPSEVILRLSIEWRWEWWSDSPTKMISVMILWHLMNVQFSIHRMSRMVAVMNKACLNRPFQYCR